MPPNFSRLRRQKAMALPRLACRTNVTFSRFLTRRSVKRARSARHAWSDCAHQIVDTFSKQYSPTIEDNFVNTILKNIWDFFPLLPLRLGIEQNSGWEIDFFLSCKDLRNSIKIFCFFILQCVIEMTPDIEHTLLLF